MRTLLATITILCALHASLAGAADRPNVIIIVADDLGYGDLGVTGHKKIETPNLDALARAGAIFQHFYSPSQVCSPSRAATITGRMPHRLGIYSFIGGSSGDLVHLPENEITLPQLLRKAGYQTAHIGKWHNSLNLVQAENDQIPSMNHYGLDYWFSSDDNASNINKPDWLRNGTNEGKKNGYTANTVGTEAVRWLQEFRKPDQPFIQFVHFYEPHWLVEAPDDLIEKYLGSATDNRAEATYFGAVSNIDREVGNILKALDQLGLAEDTAVFFTSDHGPAKLGKARNNNRSYGTAAPYRGHKYGLWEGSVHVPGIVRWPAGVDPGLVIEQPVGSIDWLPTICEITATPIPENLVIDGQSHLPLLMGRAMTRSKPLQWHHYNTNTHNSPNPNAAMRVGDYSIVGFYDPATQPKRASWRPAHLKQVKTGKLIRFALYNILEDPQQHTDLSEEEPEYFETLKRQLKEAHTEMQEQAICWDGATPTTGRAVPPGAPEIIKIMDLDRLEVANRPGIEETYKYIREPNAIVTKDGTLVVVAGPHHVRGKNDRAYQDALCRTSRDGGKTWSDITQIADAGMDSVLPTTLVYDRDRDRVLFIYNVIFNDPDRAEKRVRPCQQFAIHSNDAGKTWSEPREILKGEGGICVFGGGNGFQLEHGEHRGRLIIPGGVGGGRGFFLSDDRGGTWSFRKLDIDGRREATGCEMADGTIMLIHRQSGYGLAATYSRDGGETWSEQGALLPDAWSSCNNSALFTNDTKGHNYTIVGAPLGPENAVKFTVEADAAKLKRGTEDSRQVGRSNGGVFLSDDGGKTWPAGACVAPGWTFGYNALVALPGGEIGLIFEGSPSGVDWGKAKRDHNTGARLGIYMAKFSLDWLLAQKPAREKQSD